MKKVLLATTALALSAGVAYAEVSVSGNARMGLQYVEGTAAKAGTLKKSAILATVGGQSVVGDLSKTLGVTAQNISAAAANGNTVADALARLLTAAGSGETLTASSTTAADYTQVVGALKATINGTGAVAGGGGVPDTGLKGALAAAQLARANAIAATGAPVANTAAAGAAPTVGSDEAVAAAAAALKAAETLLAAISGAAEVESQVRFEKRMTVNMAGSVETSSGLTFGGLINLRSNEAAGTVAAGARVHMATNGFELAMGNIYGAIESMPGLYSASAGLTGLGWGGLVTNTGSSSNYFNWDAYSSSGNGAEGVEVIYSAGGFTGHVSYSEPTLSSGGSLVLAAADTKRLGLMAAYNMGDWTVAVAMQESSDNSEDKTVVTVGGKVGDFGVGFAAADNDGVQKIAINGSATMGATTVSAYVAREDGAAANPMGLGVSYDLGGASVVAGVARTAAGTNRADMGVSFSF